MHFVSAGFRHRVFTPSLLSHCCYFQPFLVSISRVAGGLNRRFSLFISMWYSGANRPQTTNVRLSSEWCT
jgi:hypothetical protein